MSANDRVPGRFLLAGLLLATLISPAAGSDIPLTSTGSLDFLNAPIAADFFGPGSLPFDGLIALTGLPLNPSTGPADSIMRIGPITSLPGTVPIEMIAMQLKSVEPISVAYGSSPPSFFDVFVELSPSPPSTGAMQLQPTSPTGGVIVDSFFDVFVDIKFVGTTPGPIFTLPLATTLVLGPSDVPLPYEDFPGTPPEIFIPPGLLMDHGPRLPDHVQFDYSGRTLPEPSTFVLAVGTLITLLGIARRRRHGHS